MDIRKVLLIAVATVGTLLPADAAKVTARLDSVRILMGRVSNLKLEVVQNEGEHGEFPLLSKAMGAPYVSVCGDSVELSRAVSRDTTELGSGRVQISWNIPVQSFDSGFYRIPAFAYVVGKDTAWSNAVDLKVVPVKVTAEDPISDDAPVSDAAGKNWTDYLPDWLYYYWWVVLLSLLAIGAGVWVVMRRRKGQPIVIAKSAPKVSPDKEALSRLARLKEKRLWEKGMEKEYFTELTDILRRYLERRFSINAMEMTSRQITDTLSANPELKDQKELVRRILDMADYVKFAKVRPLPADNVQAYDNAVAFVESTRPVEIEESKDKQLLKKSEQ